MATQNPKAAPPREVWLDQVHADETTTPMRFMVAFGIRKFANAKTLECWPSQARLAAEARVTSLTVQAEIAALRDRGHLEVICSANKRLGNRYRLLKRPETANAASRGEKPAAMRSSVRMGESTSCERGFAWPSEPAFARNLVKEPLNPSSTALLPSSADLCLEERGLDVDQSRNQWHRRCRSRGIRALPDPPRDISLQFDNGTRRGGTVVRRAFD